MKRIAIGSLVIYFVLFYSVCLAQNNYKTIQSSGKDNIVIHGIGPIEKESETEISIDGNTYVKAPSFAIKEMDIISNKVATLTLGEKVGFEIDKDGRVLIVWIISDMEKAINILDKNRKENIIE